MIGKEIIDLTSYRFSALIFDCDGTLAHTAPLHYRAMQAALRDQGQEITQDWYKARVGLSRSKLFSDFQETHNVSVDIQTACRKSQDVFKEIVAEARPIPEVVSVAKHYFGQVPLAVASGGERDLVQATLNVIGICDLFKLMVTISEINTGKPEPDIFLETACQLQINPADCLVFEDSKEGIEAARRAGMQVIDVCAMVPNNQ